MTFIVLYYSSTIKNKHGYYNDNYNINTIKHLNRRV